MKKETKAKRRKRRPQNPVAKDLRTPKYKMRVVQDKRKKGLSCCFGGCDGACLR